MAFFFFLFSFEKFNGAERSEHTCIHQKLNRKLEKTLIFKSEALMNFIIKTHKKDTVYNKPHFFVLNKGMNSGKPQNEPFTNSFVVIFDSEADSENIFWIAYSLWKSKFWHQHLVGSVISFLRLPDFKREFSKI